MTKDIYRSDNYHGAGAPPPAQPDWRRRYVNGPIRPMHRPGLLARLLKFISGDA